MEELLRETFSAMSLLMDPDIPVAADISGYGGGRLLPTERSRPLSTYLRGWLQNNYVVGLEKKQTIIHKKGN